MVFFHSTNLQDLSGPGFMLTVDMLLLFQKWRQSNTIAKLRAEREAKTRIIQSQQAETRTVEKEELTNPQDPETSQNCINNTNDKSKSGDSSLHGSDNEEMEEIDQGEASVQEDDGSGTKRTWCPPRPKTVDCNRQRLHTWMQFFKANSICSMC